MIRNVIWQKMRIAHILVLAVATMSCVTQAQDSPSDSTISDSRPRFTFDGSKYEIGRGRIIATLADPYWCDKYNKGQGKGLAWMVGFDSQSDIGKPSPPSVEFDGIEIKVNNWHRLVGYRTAWKGPINPKTDDTYGFTYWDDHLVISQCTLKIVSRDGTKFRVIARGRNEKGQLFEINGPAEFVGVYVRGSEADSDETILARLKEKFDTTNLSGTAFKLGGTYDSGVRMGEAFFRPK